MFCEIDYLFKIMKKILLTILYPFWFFFTATLVGNAWSIVLVISPIPLLISIIFPNVMTTTGNDAEGIGTGVAILTVLCFPYTTIFFLNLSDYLELNYEEWGYRTSMKSKSF